MTFRAIRLAAAAMVGLLSALGAGGPLSVADADCPIKDLRACPPARPQILSATARRNGSSVSVQITWQWPFPNFPQYSQPDFFYVYNDPVGRELARIPWNGGDTQSYQDAFTSYAESPTTILYKVCSIYNSIGPTDTLCDPSEVRVPPVPSKGPGRIDGTISWKDGIPGLGMPSSACQAFTISRAGPDNVEGFGEWFFSTPNTTFNPVRKDGRWVCGYAIVRLPLRVPISVAVQSSPSSSRFWTIEVLKDNRRQEQLVTPVASPTGWAGLVTLLSKSDPRLHPVSSGDPRFHTPPPSGGPQTNTVAPGLQVRQNPSGELEVFDINFDVTFQPLRCWLHRYDKDGHDSNPQPPGTIPLPTCAFRNR